ncbi:transglycosylase SLT domain-containing protein [Thiothrix nivea]|uniref:Lytic transglycosylase catalytic n=1 Tax=Thiothrix nivea (strain ATCC 35100 / DSM 5205 / JP2) TaxID=870187 RepID=A0A656HCM4_THINJ|nr:transglycosylase SLT domain-containing protein [Thiothrix nivea]EIJ34113.1 Lytic transglycosylase catalytic [Thiothrix nivea DSM 5205]
MITISKYAFIAISVVAVFTGSGCSSTIGKPDQQTNTTGRIQHTKTSQKKAVLQKASLHGNAQANQSQRLSYNQEQKATIDEDFDTWERVFHGFQISNHYARHPQVQQFVNYYGRKPGQLNLLSERASVFLHMIVHEVERRGMPTEIALLPFVESAFDADVFSHAGAAGLWQFIPDTGRRYGLQQVKYYDARMDPFAATGAALSYLQKLNRDFNGDWLLSLAAYNCGEKRVEREIARNRAKGLPTDFWNLTNLPKETREYVPRLLAFKELISNAPRYGITLADTPNRARLAQVRINKPIDLRKTALMAGLDANHLVNLNPCFRTGITTPEYSNRIVLPRRNAQQLIQIMEALPAAANDRVYASKPSSGYNRLATTKTGKKSTQVAKAKTRTHTVRRGETLQTIAQKHGVSVQALMKQNSKRTSRILVGERLSIA